MEQSGITIETDGCSLWMPERTECDQCGETTSQPWRSRAT